MTVEKMDSETVRADWRTWITAAGEGKTDVVIVVEGRETAALIAYTDYLALRDELVRLRADRRAALDELATSSALDFMRLDEDDADAGDGGGDSGGDGGEG